MLAQIKEIKVIPMSALSIGTAQARTREVGKDLEELAANIKKVGLLQPIVVCPADNGRFEILTGQRRFLACQKLGMTEIPAAILVGKVSPEVAKAISITENMIRQDMVQRDYIDACTFLFEKYGSVKAVSDETGLPVRKVAEYVKFAQLIPELKEEVRTGKLDLKTALRAQKAAIATTNDAAPDVVLQFANEMKGLSGLQQDNIVKAASENPEAAPEVVIEAGRRQPRQKQIIVSVSDGMHSALQKFAEEEGTTQDDAAASLIGSALEAKGYLKA